MFCFVFQMTSENYSSLWMRFSVYRIHSTIRGNWSKMLLRQLLGPLAEVQHRFLSWCCALLFACFCICALTFVRLCPNARQSLSSWKRRLRGTGASAAYLSVVGHMLQVCVFRRRGKCEQWMSNAEPHVKRVSETVCGSLMQELCESTKFRDKSCVEMFRKGASLWLTVLHVHV